MDNEVRQFLTPSLRNATENELKQIGLASFGSNLGYLYSEKKDVIKKFREELDLPDFGDSDRKKHHHILEYVEAYDRKEDERVKINETVSFTKDIPKKRLTPKEIIENLND